MCVCFSLQTCIFRSKFNSGNTDITGPCECARLGKVLASGLLSMNPCLVCMRHESAGASGTDVMRNLITQKQISRMKQDAMKKGQKGKSEPFLKDKPKKKSPK